MQCVPSLLSEGLGTTLMAPHAIQEGGITQGVWCYCCQEKLSYCAMTVGQMNPDGLSLKLKSILS